LAQSEARCQIKKSQSKIKVNPHFQFLDNVFCETLKINKN